jgi:hypothetical protein
MVNQDENSGKVLRFSKNNIRKGAVRGDNKKGKYQQKKTSKVLVFIQMLVLLFVIALMLRQCSGGNLF